MKLLLDEGLPRTAVELLSASGLDATHVYDEKLTGSSDEVLLSFAVQNSLIIVCLDSDFHMILANTQAKQPSVIRLRVAEMSANRLTLLLVDVIDQIKDKFPLGVAVSVTESHIRIHFLPLGNSVRAM